jgi:hypothetical protein
MLMYKWSLTHPTVWNRKANFKVVRLAADTSEFGEKAFLAGSHCVSPRNVIRETIKLPMEDGWLPGFSLFGDKAGKPVETLCKTKLNTSLTWQRRMRREAYCVREASL